LSYWDQSARRLSGSVAWIAARGGISSLTD
jgi:hypothetical protein